MATAQQRMATGGYGEAYAARYLTGIGMVVLDRNWRCELGELDLVLRDGRVLVFCEVKTRASAAFGSPLESVTPAKVARLRRLLLDGWLSTRCGPRTSGSTWSASSSTGAATTGWST